MRVTGWFQAGVIMLVLGIFVGGYGVGIWLLVLAHGMDADGGAKIVSPIMMLAAIPLLVVGLAMTISGLVLERRQRNEAVASESPRTEASSSLHPRAQ